MKKTVSGIVKLINTKGVQSIKNGMVCAMLLLITDSIFLIRSNFPVESVVNGLSRSVQEEEACDACRLQN